MLFRPNDRENLLADIVTFLKDIHSVSGIILVGSLSTDSVDSWADIDLSIVINPAEETASVQEQFSTFSQGHFDLYHLYESSYGEHNYLTMLFLSNYLEVDTGFISLDKLKAKRKDWKVLYDKDNLVATTMKESWAENVVSNPGLDLSNSKASILYHTRNFCVAVKRGKRFRALKEIEDLRNLCTLLWGDSKKQVGKHFRDVDIYAEKFTQQLAKTYANTDSIDEIVKTYLETIELFFLTYNEIRTNKKLDDYLKGHIAGMITAFGLGATKQR